MRRLLSWGLVLLLLAGAWLASRPAVPPEGLPNVASSGGPQTGASHRQPRTSAPRSHLPDGLPREALRTIALIQRGGPFPHAQDGSIFGNRERLLPRQARGWYREYTVDTPGLSHRGARRIVTGGNPPSEWYYSADHYDSFRRFDPGVTR